MAVNLVSLLSKAIVGSNVQSTRAVTKVSDNPFANPFVTSGTAKNYSSYAKNKPVQGGYFAGYYNGKANIVGQRIFLEA